MERCKNLSSQKNVSNGCGSRRAPAPSTPQGKYSKLDKATPGFRRQARQGISVIEAIIALLIITIMVSVLLTSQGKSLRMGVSTMFEQRVVQALQQRFVEIDKDHLDARKKAITSEMQPPLPSGTITYTARRPAAESALHRFENLYIETLVARWRDRGNETTTQLVRFHYYPEEKKDARA